MPQPDLEALEREVRDLAQRVAHLERHSEPRCRPRRPWADAAIDRPSQPASPATGERSLLRRWAARCWGWPAPTCCAPLTESNVCRPPAGVTLGIVYALLWLVWAARTPGRAPRRKPRSTA